MTTSPATWPPGWPKPTRPQVEVLRVLIDAVRAGRRPVLVGRRGGFWTLADAQPGASGFSWDWSTGISTVRAMAKRGYLEKLGDRPDYASEWLFTDIGIRTIWLIENGAQVPRK